MKIHEKFHNKCIMVMRVPILSYDHNMERFTNFACHLGSGAYWFRSILFSQSYYCPGTTVLVVFDSNDIY